MARFENVSDLKYQVLFALVSHLKIVLPREENERLDARFPTTRDPYKGSIPWSTIEYEDCERLGYFSGITIGPRSIYMKWDEDGNAQFYELEGERQIRHLNNSEFWSLMGTLFSEEQLYWIQKDIWRTGS